MDFSQTYFIYLLVLNIESLTAQFLSMNRKMNKSNPCDSTHKTAIVEQFFNVIFTEFHNSPPVCVCVQMCADQPTYCYPNNCLKKVESKKKNPEENKPSAPVNVHNSDIDKTMFLVENDYVSNENINSKNFRAETFSIKDVRPDPFKDRYKSLFKYKKMPKVELRYNLREQVKNMKSDILKIETQDVSKSRWPKNNYMMLREQQMFKIGDKNQATEAKDGSSHKFFIHAPGIERDAYSPKFFKRDLRRNSKDDFESHPEFSTDTPDYIEAKTFSLETLIDNLLGHNYDRRPNGDLELKSFNDSQSQVIDVANSVNMTNNNLTKDDKEVTCVLSLNMTNENLDENKYEESSVIKKHLDKWKNYTFNDMITALSKQIDKQNNTSLEMMKDIPNDKIQVTITGPDLKDKDQLKILDEIVPKIVVNNDTKVMSSTEPPGTVNVSEKVNDDRKRIV